MLQSNKIDISGENDDNKTDVSCECIIFHYWYFLKIKFRFQAEVLYGCHNLIQEF